MDVPSARVGETFEIPHDLVPASGQKLGLNRPGIDKTAAFRRFGEAAVNCTFSRIEWGKVNSKKACMVCIDASISWTKSYVLDTARLDLTVASNSSS